MNTLTDVSILDFFQTGTVSVLGYILKPANVPAWLDWLTAYTGRVCAHTHTHTYNVNICNVASGVPRLAITELREHSISVCAISMNWTKLTHHPFKHSGDVREAATTPPQHSLSLQPESIYHQTDGVSLNKHSAVVWRWRSLRASANVKLNRQTDRRTDRQTGQLRQDVERWDLPLSL